MKTKGIIKVSVMCAALLAADLFVYGQDSSDDLFDLSLEELMNIPIVSASKKKETVFEAPLSSYSITSNEITNSGATSIPEALRLCPGLIVREYNNGNYDVHIRGFDNISRYTNTNDQPNRIILVMIDDRPVFNYNYGNTIWEALPVDLIDVERIEVVAGPSAPLFGPNAVAGVINIITRRPEKEGLDVSANAQFGSPNTLIGNLYVGSKLNEKLDVGISGNYQIRDRHEELYYDYTSDEYSDLEQEDSELAQKKYGINGFLNYEHNDLDVQFSTGYQDARVQKVFLGNTAPAFSNNHSYYVNLISKFKKLSTRISYTNGFDELGEMTKEIGASSEYDYSNFNANFEYAWDLLDSKLEIVPSFNYQDIVYDDSRHIEGIRGIFNREVSLKILGGGIKADFRPVNKLRLVSALRLDSYDTPDDTYFSYQFMGTYKPSDDILLRAVYARSNSSSFMVNSFIDVNVVMPGNNTNYRVRGNENLDLAVNTISELGARWQMLDNLQVDVAIFHQEIEDLSFTVANPPQMDPESGMIVMLNSYENLDLVGKQNGATLTLGWVPNSKLIIKPFITYQKTQVENLMGSDETEEHRSTPSYYGGAYINYTPFKKLNIGINPYVMSNYELYHTEDLNRTSQEGIFDGNLILNTKVSYSITDKLDVYFNGRNIGGNSREYYGTDKIAGLYLGGLSYNF